MLKWKKQKLISTEKLMNFNEISRKNSGYDDIKKDKKYKAQHFLQVAYFLRDILRVNETSILASAELAIFHSI